MPEISDQRYNEMLRAEQKLQRLERAGVYNWEGYNEALGIEEYCPDCEELVNECFCNDEEDEDDF